MIKFEMHAHCAGASLCALCDIKTLIDEYKKAGYGGIVLTNHYDVYNFYNTLPAGTFIQKNDYYFSLYEQAKEYGAKQCIKVFWGAEIRSGYGIEYILIGLDKKLFYNRSKPLFSYSQKMLFDLAETEGAFMYQTHPFRENVVCVKPNLMHGVEAFNGHFHHDNNNEKALQFANENNLIKMSGTDYHEKDQPITSCMYIPEEINDEKALAKYLLQGNTEYFGDEEYYITQRKKYLREKKCK